MEVFLLLSIEIKRPIEKDLDNLNLFFRVVIEDTFEREGIAHLVDDIESEIIEKQKYLKLDLDSNRENRYFLLAIINNQIIGTIEYGPVSKLISDLTNGELQDLVEVGTVFVRPDYQGKGIGTLLWNAMYLTLQSKGIDEFCLDSGYSNAQKIWKKKFGKPDYLIKDYWSEGNDHMIWRRKARNNPIIFKL